ncbi:hypothetical protein FB565_003132 [Actinoplanes lutulentus]|uniref:Polysaccharide deacetylase n=1 Tax=Actinoplanes lutulentus TaxID=1287878 RepID=A0A327Z1S1_9ACTN|nr:polysaccharide deacetylase family protein [Actinoplanes lutulentus]MBB2943419.1 hypothetical protein [Actinoplanes lutulentus]RAK26062.1 polysaccharide deacetylase [Actinoplanes lutulentus]
MIPVLLYHSVSEASSPFAITDAVFREHLRIIVASGRTPMTVSELFAGDGPKPERPVVVTVDDGFTDTATVAGPLLAEHRIPATVYVTTAFLGGRNRLDRAGVRDLHAMGHEIGGHSVHHRELDVLPARQAHAEVIGCRDTLRDLLGVPVHSFAYPYGYASARVRRLVAAAGHTTACAVRDTHATAAEPPYAVSRLTVRATTDTDRLRGWLDGTIRPQAWARDGLAVRGWRAYRAVRTRASPWRKTSV